MASWGYTRPLGTDSAGDQILAQYKSGIDGTGGTAHNFRFSTTLGEALAAALVPASLYTRMPLTGRAVATALTWVPTVVAALLAISFDKRYLRVTRLPRPGALPSALAEALRHVEVPPPGEVWPL